MKQLEETQDKLKKAGLQVKVAAVSNLKNKQPWMMSRPLPSSLPPISPRVQYFVSSPSLPLRPSPHILSSSRSLAARSCKADGMSIKDFKAAMEDPSAGETGDFVKMAGAARVGSFSLCVCVRVVVCVCVCLCVAVWLCVCVHVCENT